MPTYEYVCKDCGETVEVFQSFSDKPLKKHKECGGALQKVFHARGIVFKGGGFYATDNKAAPSSKGPSESTATDKTEKKTSAASEKKSSAAAGSTTSTSSSTSDGD
jgi:putative FmdB family regulatory protein